MNLSLRIFFAYILLTGLSTWIVMQNVTGELVPGMRQSLEEVLIDTANLLAEIVENEMVEGSIGNGHFSKSISAFKNRNIGATIYNLQKNDSNLIVYITDQKGIVRYDSTRKHIDKDYSQWNDVYLTLRGKYGARTTRRDKNDSTTSVMYVAAPIKHNGQIVGVVSIGKPSASIQPFFDRAVRNIEAKVLLLLLGSLAFIMLVVYWLTLSIRRLTRYARDVKQGKRTAVPLLRDKDLAQLGHAMEEMRVSLEGKDYIENYLHTLTHEIKSPLTAIQGAVELLQEDVPTESRERFIRNIANESQRLQQVVEQLLKLASLEKKQELETLYEIPTRALLIQLCEDKIPVVKKKNVTFDYTCVKGSEIVADRFLIQMAMSNLLDNAIDFSPESGTIFIEDKIDSSSWILIIRDQGPGIPDYAIERVFERFYSLPRPDTGNKSTGLGLSLVYEVALLHKGSITIRNYPEGGAEIQLILPCNQ